MTDISVLGAGTWGTALARTLAIGGNRVTLWSKIPSDIETLARTHRHPNLKDAVLPDSVHLTVDLEEACRERDAVLFAVPSVYVRNTAREAAPFLPDGMLLLDAAKGLEAGSHKTMTEVIREEMERCGGHGHMAYVALSGPTHAEEVALDLPTAIVAASLDRDASMKVQKMFEGTCLRVYANRDIRGVEVCGALKNIIALATGIAVGAGCGGDNMKAALLTRGMAEIARLETAMGCSERTVSGLSGIGDIIVTATSMHSRNNRAGLLIGGGMPVSQAVAEVGMVVEGLHALPAAMELKERYQVEMPIVEAVHEVVDYGKNPKDVIGRLLKREMKDEF